MSPAFRSVAVTLVVLLKSAPALAGGGSYSLDYAAADPDLYGVYIGGGVSCPFAVGEDPIDPPSREGSDDAEFGAPKLALESLLPEDMALGQVVVFLTEIAVEGSTSPENGKIRMVHGFETETTSGKDFGFDHDTEGVICAFVDKSDSAHVDPGKDARVKSWSWAMDGSTIESTIEVEGLDDGDNVVVEMWLVLDEEIPGDVSGNVQTEIREAETIADPPETVNVGNMTVPLLQVGKFFNNDADVSIEKGDDPDPVDAESTLTYTVVATNNSVDVVANEVVVTDTLDANTEFVSVSSDDLDTTCSHDGSPTGGVVTCDAGALEPLEVVTITIEVTVLDTAPRTETGGPGPCVGGEDLCNEVSVSAINDDPDTGNNADSEPTAVSESVPKFPGLAGRGAVCLSLLLAGAMGAVIVRRRRFAGAT